MSNEEWKLLNDGNPPIEGCSCIEFRDVYDGGLFWWYSTTNTTYKRWNDQFYKDRCPDIEELMNNWCEAMSGKVNK